MLWCVSRESHTKRQGTQHYCLPCLLGDGVKVIEIVYGEGKLFCTGPTRAAKAGEKSFVPARQANEPTKEGPLSFVLFESPFTSVSTVGRGLSLGGSVSVFVTAEVQRHSEDL